MKPLTQGEAATLYFLPLLYMMEKKGEEPIIVEVHGYVREKGLFLVRMTDHQTGEAYMESIYSYGQTWRLWGKRPTAKERDEAKWKER